MMPLWEQIVWLLILAIPIACLSRTVVYEEIFREPRDFCIRKSQTCRSLFQRKFFYLFTCEYCFSHYITAIFLFLTAAGEREGFKMLIPDWRGYVISFFSLVLMANLYLNLYGRLRLDIHRERVEIKGIEQEQNGSDIGKGD